MEKKLVVHSNALVRSVHRMTITELKLMYYCTTMVRRDGDFSDDNRHFEITHQDFSESMGLKNSYQEIKNAAFRLQQRIILIDEEIIDTDGTVWDGGAISILSAQKWKDGEGKIKLSFAPEFMPYLTKLNGSYTKMFLEEIEPMKSLHAVRIYSLALAHYNIHKSNPKPPHWLIEIAELRRMFELTKKYKKHNDFKRKVIDVAVNEINKYSRLKLVYTPVKKGRRIDAYSFKVTEKSMVNQIKSGSMSEKKIQKACDDICKAFESGKSIKINGNKVVDITDSVVSFEGGAGNLFSLVKNKADVVSEQVETLF